MATLLGEAVGEEGIFTVMVLHTHGGIGAKLMGTVVIAQANPWEVAVAESRVEHSSCVS